jgi:hypothetical protein
MESVKQIFREDNVKDCWRCGHPIPTGSVCVICGNVNKSAHVPTRRETRDGDPDDRLSFRPNSQKDEAELEAVDESELCRCYHVDGSHVCNIQHVECSSISGYTKDNLYPAKCVLLSEEHEEILPKLNSKDHSPELTTWDQMKESQNGLHQAGGGEEDLCLLLINMAQSMHPVFPLIECLFISKEPLPDIGG